MDMESKCVARRAPSAALGSPRCVRARWPAMLSRPPRAAQARARDGEEAPRQGERRRQDRPGGAAIRPSWPHCCARCRLPALPAVSGSGAAGASCRERRRCDCGLAAACVRHRQSEALRCQVMGGSATPGAHAASHALRARTGSSDGRCVRWSEDEAVRHNSYCVTAMWLILQRAAAPGRRSARGRVLRPCRRRARRSIAHVAPAAAGRRVPPRPRCGAERSASGRLVLRELSARGSVRWHCARCMRCHPSCADAALQKAERVPRRLPPVHSAPTPAAHPARDHTTAWVRGTGGPKPRNRRAAAAASRLRAQDPRAGNPRPSCGLGDAHGRAPASTRAPCDLLGALRVAGVACGALTRRGAGKAPTQVLRSPPDRLAGFAPAARLER